MRYVLFLDIDGVFNSRGFFRTDLAYREYHKNMPDMAHRVDTKNFMRRTMDPAAVRNLAFILENLKGDVEIWISSSWGLAFDLKDIKATFKSRGLGDLAKLIRDVTPRKMSSWRCNEIGWALDEIAETGTRKRRSKSKSYDGPIRWISIDDNNALPKGYCDTVIFRNKNFKVEYDPDYIVNPFNGLTFTDSLAILKLLDPTFDLTKKEAKEEEEEKKNEVHNRSRT